MTKNYFKLFVAGIIATTSIQFANSQAWDGTSAKWTNGDGTETNPFLIENAQQFAYLSEQVNAGQTFENQYFKITKDLDLGKKEGKIFPIIGKFDTYFDSDAMQKVDKSLVFKGTLDGDFHTIDNFAIEYKDEELGGTGLFAVTKNETVIRNLILGANSSITGEVVCGGFVGQMLGGKIENCQNKAAVNGNMYTGGFVGCMEGGSVTNCVNNGTVNGATEVGGIVGQGAENGTVSFCYNTASVTASGFGGAGIGGALYDSFSISNCYSIGAVAGQSSPWMGSPHAIVSDAGSCKVTNCYYVKALTVFDDTKATEKTADEMKAASFLTLINADVTPSAFVADTKNLNNGFPVLAWQSEKNISGVQDIINYNSSNITVTGNMVTSTDSMNVYDLNGKLIASGNEITLSAGFYIVKTLNDVKKIVIK